MGSFVNDAYSRRVNGGSNYYSLNRYFQEDFGVNDMSKSVDLRNKQILLQFY